jgi:hypothetical protein
LGRGQAEDMRPGPAMTSLGHQKSPPPPNPEQRSANPPTDACSDDRRERLEEGCGGRLTLEHPSVLPANDGSAEPHVWRYQDVLGRMMKVPNRKAGAL